MVAQDRDKSRQAYERAERRIQLCAFEVRRRDRQLDAFYEEQWRVRVANSNNDSASTAVFHGAKQETVRERLLREHREQVEQEQRRKEHRQALALRRVARAKGILHFCRHCNRQLFRGTPGDKCDPCKNNPELVTARGRETRSFVPHREAQPSIMPLSITAERVFVPIQQLEPRMREAIELRYFNRLSDREAAERLGISVARFAGYACAAVAQVGALLANPKSEP